MDEGIGGHASRIRSAGARDESASRSVRRRLWGATVLLFLAAVFGLASFGVQEVPRFRAEGLAPGAWYESPAARTSRAAIHFETHPPCVFQGPRYEEVRAALARARTVAIECAEGELASIVIGVEVDGVPVLAQRDAAAFWSRDSSIARIGLVACAVGGLALLVAALAPAVRRGRATRAR